MRNRKTQYYATGLRKQLTDAERKLWQGLRARQLNGFKFRRQYPVGPFIADFACIEARLIVEIDGGQHNERQHHDVSRTRWLQTKGFTVLRFWNDQVLLETTAVLDTIQGELRQATPPPQPSPARGGGSQY